MGRRYRTMSEIRDLISRISMTIFDKVFKIRCEVDNKYDAGRLFVQAIYTAKCNKTGEEKEWHGRKYYLSEYMEDDEIIKTCFTAFKAAVDHEVMEGFKVDGIVLFNPHVKFEELLKVSHLETQRQQHQDEKG